MFTRHLILILLKRLLLSFTSELDDSAFVKHIPEYISRADKNGYFRIDNVREQKYRLYALKDADNSKNFNLYDEEMAFLDSAVVVTPEKNYLPVTEDTMKVKPTDPKVCGYSG